MSCPKDFISYVTVFRQNYPNNGRTPSLVHVGFDWGSISRSSDLAHWNPLLCNFSQQDELVHVIKIARLEFSERLHIVSLSVPYLLYPGPRGFSCFSVFFFSAWTSRESENTSREAAREKRSPEVFQSHGFATRFCAALSKNLCDLGSPTVPGSVKMFSRRTWTVFSNLKKDSGGMTK